MLVCFSSIRKVSGCSIYVSLLQIILVNSVSIPSHYLWQLPRLLRETLRHERHAAEISLAGSELTLNRQVLAVFMRRIKSSTVCSKLLTAFHTLLHTFIGVSLFF